MSPSSMRRTDDGLRPGEGGPTMAYSPFVPLLVLLLTLIFTTGRDIVILKRHKAELVAENARASQPLTELAKRAVLVDELHTDLVTLAKTDPVAARILADFFSPPAANQAPRNSGD